jgi:regulatory protein
MRITSIESIPRRPGWRRIFGDGVLLATASDETVLRLGLRSGDELSAAVLRSLQELQTRQHARQVALRFLSHRPRTQREIRDRLREEECDDTVIAETLGELERAGLVNDRAFAEAFIRDQTLRRPSGSRLLRQKLLLLGVERTIVDEVIQAAAGATGEREAAEQAAEKLLQRAQTPRTPEEVRKLRTKIAGALGRRGFTWDVIGDVLRRMPWTQNDTDPGE